MFGNYLWATVVLVVAVAMLEQYDQKWAYVLAILTLLTIFLTHNDAIQKIANLLPKTAVSTPPRNEAT